jgi:hypothetical protein
MGSIVKQKEDRVDWETACVEDALSCLPTDLVRRTEESKLDSKRIDRLNLSARGRVLMSRQ